MNVHYLQHVPFEDLGSMEPWLRAQGHRLSATHLYRGEVLPEPSAPDALIVMGGPMNVADDAQHPWLTAEKDFLEAFIRETDKPVLGICLGAQLIAHVLGARVGRNAAPEIGWFPVTPDPAFSASRWGHCLEPGMPVFHWHGDSFDLPAAALPVGHTSACANQGFVLDDRIVGLQFHLETTAESARHLVRACGDELDGSRYVQSADAILAAPKERYEAINRAMSELLHLWLTPA